MFTNIAFVIQTFQPQEQKTLCLIANKALVGTLMTIGDVNDIFPILIGVVMVANSTGQKAYSPKNYLNSLLTFFGQN